MPPYRRARRSYKRRYSKASPRKFRRGYNRTGGLYRSQAQAQQELKVHDTTLDYTIDSTAENMSTNAKFGDIAQGTTTSTRIGNEITIKSMQVQAVLTYTPTASSVSATSCSIYLVLDKQCNGAAPSMLDVFDSQSVWRAMPNLANKKRFQIIKKFQVVFNSGSSVSATPDTQMQVLNWYGKMNIPIEYSSTTGVIGEIKSNCLFMFAGSQGSDDKISWNGTTRTRFVDSGSPFTISPYQTKTTGNSKDVPFASSSGRNTRYGSTALAFL